MNFKIKSDFSKIERVNLQTITILGLLLVKF